MIVWLLIAASLGLAFFHSAWWLIATVVLSLWKAQQWHFYNSRPWRRVHYPAMRCYAVAAGLETAQAENEKREWNIKNALRSLVQQMHAELGVAEADQLMQTAITNLHEKADLAPMAQHLMAKGISSENIQKFISLVDQQANRNDKGLQVRAVIAVMIEKKFSAQDAGEYLVEVHRGNAN